MKKVAYHEAGHFAARLFTRLELSHVIEISILGNGEIAGYEKAEKNIAELTLNLMPPTQKRAQGYMLLLNMLAGYGAEMLLDKSNKWESIFEYCNSIYSSEESGIEGSDLYRTFEIARIIAKPFTPLYRIIKLADKWTLEMLEIPEIWEFVESVASKLLKQGILKKDELNYMISDSYTSQWINIHDRNKWRKRLFPKPLNLPKLKRWRPPDAQEKTTP